jgi:hypothetical protein
MRPLPTERPRARWGFAHWLLAGFTVLAVGMGLPIVPYHSVCRQVYEDRMRYSREPQVTPEWAAAIRAWAVTDGCRICDRRGRVSLLQYLYLNDWSLFSSQRATAG